MITSIHDKAEVSATNVHFEHKDLIITINDGREVCHSTDQTNWFSWLVNVIPQHRENWTLEQSGYAIYWED